MASQVTGWLTPLLVCASLLLLGWSFYNRYVLGLGTAITTAITWASLLFIVCFWTWHFVFGVWSMG